MYEKILALQELFKNDPNVISITFQRYGLGGPEPQVHLTEEAFFGMLDPTRTLEQNGAYIEYAESCNCTFVYLKRGGVRYETCFPNSHLTEDAVEVLHHAK